MSEVEHTLQRYGEFLLESGLAKEKHARYFVRTMICTHVVMDLRNPATIPLDLMSGSPH